MARHNVENLGKENEQILALFSNSTKNDFWKTANEIAAQTGVPVEKVYFLVVNSDEFVQSKDENTNEVVYTTLDNFRKYQSVAKKILGAFKNRID